MAGDWIPATTDLPRKREVLALTRVTGIKRREVVGILLEFWIWASEQTADGVIDGVFIDQLPDIIDGVKPIFWNTLASQDIGWLEETPTGLIVPRAKTWITKGAKGRIQKTRRQEKWRDADVDDQPSTSASTQPSTREEKSREENRRVEKEHRTTCAGDFDAWWRLYPNRKAKADAKKAWSKLRPTAWQAAALSAAVMQSMQSEAWTRDGGKYIPYPATWLRGARWEDEQPPPQSALAQAARPFATRKSTSAENSDNIRQFLAEEGIEL